MFFFSFFGFEKRTGMKLKAKKGFESTNEKWAFLGEEGLLQLTGVVLSVGQIWFGKVLDGINLSPELFCNR